MFIVLSALDILKKDIPGSVVSLAIGALLIVVGAMEVFGLAKKK